MSYFVGAKCNDGDHIGEGDPKSKDDDIDTTNGKLITVNWKISGVVLGKSLFPEAIDFHKRRSNRMTQNRGSMLHPS